MNHTITKQDVEKAMAGHTVTIASSSSAEGVKRLVYQFDRAMYVLTVDEKFRFETTDPADAATAYSQVRG